MCKTAANRNRKNSTTHSMQELMVTFEAEGGKSHIC